MILDAGRIGVAGQALGIGQVRYPVRINGSDYMGLAISIYQVYMGSLISIKEAHCELIQKSMCVTEFRYKCSDLSTCDKCAMRMEKKPHNCCLFGSDQDTGLS